MKSILKVHSVIFALLILICVSSCSVTNNFDSTGKVVFLDSSNYQLINGTYNNINISGNFSVYDVFNKYKTFHKQINNADVVVTVKAVNPKKVELCFMENTTCVDKIILRGHFENGYFSANKRYSILNPLFPVLWGPAFYKREIGFSKSGSLIIFDSRGALVFFLIIPFWVDGNENMYEYNRIEQ